MEQHPLLFLEKEKQTQQSSAQLAVETQANLVMTASYKHQLK